MTAGEDARRAMGRRYRNPDPAAFLQATQAPLTVFSLQVVADSPDLRPTRAHDDDAGFDLYTSVDTPVYPRKHADVPCGVRIGMPPGVWGLIIGRSSTLRKRGLHVQTNVIDTGYTGPMFAGVWHDHEDVIVVKRGERIAQLVLLPNLAQLTRVVPVDELGTTTRGENGFGSSGR